jgi:hypothetical protein
VSWSMRGYQKRRVELRWRIGKVEGEDKGVDMEWSVMAASVRCSSVHFSSVSLSLSLSRADWVVWGVRVGRSRMGWDTG